MSLAQRLDRVIAETEFSGVVRVSCGERVLYVRAAGFAERAHAVPNTLATQFAIASGTKGLTALAAVSLVADGALALDAELRSLLAGSTLEALGPGIDGRVSVRQLLAHTSGIGDYLDESVISDIEEPVLEVPVHRLQSPADFLPLLRGRAPKFSPGAGFAYCNSGYVLLALVLEAVSRQSYHTLVQERVCAAAGLQQTAFLRLDELPGSAAIGYLPRRNWRTNHLHLPVCGGGDGGAYSTAGDLARLWSALFARRIVPPALLAEMLRPQAASAPGQRATAAYGLGFWLSRERGTVFLEGCDPGISFRSSFDPATGLLCSVLSNTTSGAWPVVRELEASPLSPE
jgi:CubicO group peptidase (beta-lactamase class C family)